MEEDKDLKNTVVYIEDEIQKSYLDYSMSVIVGRALPDARDGLKPVHRRILFAMSENGMSYMRPFKKSARIVGEVLGKYHPHGDSSVYYAMVRMGQDFNTRYLLIDGQGNYGSVDGDSPASMRYTEARMARLSSEMVADLDKNTVNFRDNFDETLQEPVVLPSKIPNLLLNGSSGIAVGMATNIPPHNLTEVINATIAYIDNRESTSEELAEHVLGPDFPTGATIMGRAGIASAYSTGRGKIKIRAKARIEDLKNGAQAIIVTEIPYQVNKSSLIQQIAEHAKDKKIEGISDLRDESDRDGIRIYIEVKKNEDADIVLNKLYKFTNLQVTYGIIMLAIVNKIPKVLNLRQMIEIHVNHRVEVVTRRVQFELDKAEKRLHILEGFRIAIDNIDEVVQMIKKSKDPQDAKDKLMDRFKLSEIQSKAILDMRLQKLTGLEVTKLDEEMNFLRSEIVRFKQILGDKEEVYKIIKEELEDIRNTYSDKRRSEIVDDISEISIEDMIQDDEVFITVTNNGYVKRMTLDNYRAQSRGGKGYTGQTLNDEDFIKSITHARNLDTLLLFTNKGKVYSMKVYEIPELLRGAKGRLFSNIISLDVGERVKSIIKTRDMEQDASIFFVTRKGTVKKTKLSLFANINKSGIIAVKLRPGDDLINSFLITDEAEIFLATYKGYALRFKSSEVRSCGRSSFGVRGIALRDDDVVVAGSAVYDDSAVVLTISENGYGKKSKIAHYSTISRARKGVINMKVSNKTGNVISVEEIRKEDEVVLITSKGCVIRTSSDEISTIGRATQGVRIMKLRADEKVVDVAKVIVE